MVTEAELLFVCRSKEASKSRGSLVALWTCCEQVSLASLDDGRRRLVWRRDKTWCLKKERESSRVLRNLDR